MKHLFKNEIYRFRKLAIGVALLHLVGLRAIEVMAPVFSVTSQRLLMLLLSILAFALSIYQMASLKRPGQWTFLIHRPLAPSHIFTALVSAGLALIGIAIVLPQILTMLWLDLRLPNGVESRALGQILYLAGVAACSYLLGATIALSRHRSAFLALALLTFVITRQAVGWWLFVPLVAIFVWLVLLAAATFKPDLATPIEQPWGKAAALVALGYAFFGVCTFALILIHTFAIIFLQAGIGGLSTFGWNDYFPAGTVAHLDYRDPAEVLLHGLEDVPTADPLLQNDRSHLRAQLGLASVIELPSFILKRPTRFQPVFLDLPQDLVDREQAIRYAFDHDEMMFLGVDERSGRAAGRWGRRGLVAAAVEAADRFPEVPIAVADDLVLTSREILEADFKRGRLEVRFEAPLGESLILPGVSEEGFLLTATEKALYFFEPRDLSRKSVRLEPWLEVPLPTEPRRISRVVLAELVDSVLVSFVISTRKEVRHPAEQIVVEATFAERAQRQIARRPLILGHAPWYTWSDFWISPAFHSAHDLTWSQIAPHWAERVTWDDFHQSSAPPVVRWLALATAVLSALATFWLGRRRGLSVREAGGWTLGSLLLGLPGFLAFWCLTEQDEAIGFEVEARHLMPAEARA